jgi:2-succinyl-5-enolpyruvyl-6-hydroxy-3-cyclohexene-1-carboxylate synthase
MWHVPEFVAGTYSWTGNSTLNLAYHPSQDARKAYKASLAELREKIRQTAESARDQYAQGIASAASKFADEIPEKEELQVGLSERKEPQLVVTSEKGMRYAFRKAK